MGACGTVERTIGRRKGRIRRSAVLCVIAVDERSLAGQVVAVAICLVAIQGSVGETVVEAKAAKGEGRVHNYMRLEQESATNDDDSRHDEEKQERQENP